MPLFGPRLDRPSAVGDEGRPRATSLTIASVAVVGVVLATGYVTGLFTLFTGMLTLTALVTLGLALLNRERFLALFIGQLCYVLGGTGIVGLVGTILVLAPSFGMLVTGFALALVSLTATWANVGDSESTKTALFQGGLSYLMMLVWVVVVVIVVLAAAIFWTFLTTAAGTVPPTLSVVAFLASLVVSSLLVLLATRWLPVRQLAPRDWRPRVETALRQARIALLTVAAASVFLVIATLVAWFLGAFDVLYAALPPVAGVFGTLSHPFVLGGVAFLGLASLLAAVAALLVRRATRPVDARANRLLAGVVAGFAFTVLLLPFLFSFVPLPLLLRILVAALLVLFGPVTLLLVGATLLVGVELEVLPDRAGGPALAAAGMVLATIGAGLVGAPAPVVFACAVAGMLVWDVSTFGLGITAELGHIPETRRMELFHGVLSVGLGALLVGILTTLDFVRTGALSGFVAVPAVVVAGIGVLVLLAPLRG